MKTLLAALVFVASWAQAQPSFLLFDLSSQSVVHGENIYETRPLASITKLMTAMVSLDYDRNLKRSLVRNKGNKITRYNAFNFLLIRSDNGMAELMARDYPGGRPAFVAAMNRRARQLGMLHTNFEDPSGLSNNNRSTAYDISRMLEAASYYPVITDISPQPQTRIEVAGKRRTQQVLLRNTNFKLLYEFQNTVVSKTGFTTAAGRCIAMIIEHNGRRYSVVVLGTRTVEQRTRAVEDLFHNHTRA
jgi:D-alanyl-D-alanine endopeptidase (penicillin-binding protein 7)